MDIVAVKGKGNCPDADRRLLAADSRQNIMEGTACIMEQRKSQRLGWLLGGRIMKIYFNKLINIGKFVVFFYGLIIS